MRMLSEVVAVRAGIAFGLLFALAAVCVAARVGLVVGLIAYLGACGLAAGALSLGYAELVALSGWGFLTGFVVNRGGQLTFHASDLEHLALLLLLAATVVVLRGAGQGSRV